jgi:hypothetical protein
MENEVLFSKIDKMFKELDLNIQISNNLLDFNAAKLEELKEKFNKIREVE